MASITIPSAAKLSILLSAPIILLLLVPASSASYGVPASPVSYGNVLSSGNALAAGRSLVHGELKFIMQYDCNLVLYEGEDPIWSSRTDGRGTNCSLVLQKNGELFINTASGVTVWRSETGGEYGYYALVLQPNRDVVVYGSPVWSTGTYKAPV